MTWSCTRPPTGPHLFVGVSDNNSHFIRGFVKSITSVLIPLLIESTVPIIPFSSGRPVATIIRAEKPKPYTCLIKSDRGHA